MPGRSTAVKRLLLGRPGPLREVRRVLLPRPLAVPSLGTDALSSLAYVHHELLAALAVAGAAGLALGGPLAAGAAALLALVVWGLVDVARHHPHGGGYAAAGAELGRPAALLAAGAELVDRVLTMAVAAAAAAAAVVAVMPPLAPYRVGVAAVVVAATTFASLRGLREARRLVALPAALFVAVLVLVVLVGAARCVGGCPAPDGAGAAAASEPLTAVVVLRAVAAAAMALTGLGAAARGLPLVRYPQQANLAAVLWIVAGLAAGLLVALAALAHGVGATGEGERTVLAQLGAATLGEGPGLLAVQAATVLVLLAAASSVSADVPRLAALLARDRHAPVQLAARGDRLTFTNPLLAVAAAALATVALAGGSVGPLVGPYVVAAAVPLVLALLATARLRARRRARRRAAALAAIGLLLAGVGAAGLTTGAPAWAALGGAVALAGAMAATRRHYEGTARRLAFDGAPAEAAPNHVVIVLERVDEAAARAVSYARTLRPASLEALAAPAPGADVPRRWAELAPELPLEVLDPGDRAPAAAIRRALTARGAAVGEAFTTAVVPEALSRSWLDQLTHHGLALRLRSGLLADEGVVITDLTSPPGGPGPYTIEDPREHHVLLLVSSLDHAAMRALAYARGLRPSTLRGLAINIDPPATRRLRADWEAAGLDVPLELVDTPARELSTTLRRYVRSFTPDGRSTVVTCVLPEVVVDRRWQRPLHNQTQLMVKSTLLFERGVVTTGVPTRLPPAEEASS